MKKLLCILLFLFSLAAAYHFIFSPHFSLDMMIVDCKEETDCWEGIPLTDKEKQTLLQLLNQPFTYLDKGHQSYAFKSADGKYVLKFFHFERMRSSPLWQYLETIPFMERYTDKNRDACDKRFRRATTGYAVAYKYDKDNCGLLFMRLGCIPHIPQTVLLIDQWGGSHPIDLDKTYFVIQHLATPANQAFSNFLSNNQLVEVKKLVNKIFALYLEEYKRGVYDFDHNLMHNVGFFDGHAMRMDIGKLQYLEKIKDPHNYLADLKLILQRIDEWMGRHYPFYRKELKLYMDQQLENISHAELPPQKKNAL